MQQLDFSNQIFQDSPSDGYLAFKTQIDTALFSFILKQDPNFNQWFLEIESYEQGFSIHPLTFFCPILLTPSFFLMAYPSQKPSIDSSALLLSELGKSWQFILLSKEELEQYGF